MSLFSVDARCTFCRDVRIVIFTFEVNAKQILFVCFIKLKQIFSNQSEYFAISNKKTEIEFLG